MADHSRRLDSWKDVAEYLGRDVRTAMRWAKSHGLPVRRVGGGRGRSVFAYTDEIDAWLAGAAPAPTVALPAPTRRRTPVALVGAVVAALVAALAMGMWFSGSAAQGASLSVIATDDGVMLRTQSGRVNALYRFDPALVPVFTPAPPTVEGQGATGFDVLVGVSSYLDRRQRGARNGELLHLSIQGRVHWRFAFDDKLDFPGERFDGPWGLTDWSVGHASAAPRIAIAAHHETWWPSVATVIDADARRLSTFVHPGWIESVLWIDERRLAAAGFANQHDAAMLAVVDTHEPQSVTPGTGGTPFACTSCAGSAPLLYVTFARSELNQLTAGRFNRARIVRQHDRFVVTTVEFAGDPVSAAAIYEFDTEFRLISARYDDVYWTLHQQLEREGRLAHTRASCPQANGPAGMQAWQSGQWVPLTPVR